MKTIPTAKEVFDRMLSENDEQYSPDADLILNAYPLENIK